MGLLSGGVFLDLKENALFDPDYPERRPVALFCPVGRHLSRHTRKSPAPQHEPCGAAWKNGVEGYLNAVPFSTSG